MNKNQIAMAAIGGAGALAAAVFGVLVWLEGDTQEELRDNLEANRAKRARYAHAVKATEDAHKANGEAAKKWAGAAYGFAGTQGSWRRDPSQEPAAFKQQMMEEARAISKLPKDAAAKIVKEGFPFGFNAYINEGAMPKRDDLPKLQREWDDIVRICHILVDCGVAELTGVSVAEAEAPAETPRPGARRAQQKKDPADAYPSAKESYVVTFLARPAALVGVLNALATDNRFFAVSDLVFEQPNDPLLMMLGGDKEKEKQGGRRGRRRRGAVEEEEKPLEGEAAEIARKGLVTDPAVCAPFAVSMKISTLDFSPKEDKR